MSSEHPASTLAEEHQIVARLVQALSALADRVEAGQVTPAEDLNSLVHAFRNFVDLGHHEKEESVLIPELTRAGVNWNSPGLAAIRAEHDQERYLVRSLRHSAHQDAPWSKDDEQHFVSVARELATLLHAHLQAENEHLLPLVRDRLPEERVDWVCAEFAKIDASLHPTSARDALLSLADRICRAE